MRGRRGVERRGVFLPVGMASEVKEVTETDPGS